MQPVRDTSGNRYLLVKRSTDSSRVCDPETGEERYVPTADLEPVADESGLETAAAAVVPTAVRRVLTAIHDDRSLGLLVVLVDRGPLSVRELLDGTDYCESDLHGLLAELRAAGLIAETEIAGHRGYAATEVAETAVADLRSIERE
ncbi:hypothetical protein SAMN05192561_101457 [Halopenitus malekzadehii]|uniref:Uncharacterized protein n=1 Tax=Halopenitus malekzadehii TaxID=1267564 RepID=A0A1H6HY43_9EURY|nr:hypothetical protein [Halopenitus malekzadehii]SEH39090.1 hypothetical protein SAMN05192561_101457 [Halopenitus malekzadehii]